MRRLLLLVFAMVMAVVAGVALASAPGTDVRLTNDDAGGLDQNIYGEHAP
jgi:hypothetical protein